MSNVVIESGSTVSAISYAHLRATTSNNFANEKGLRNRKKKGLKSEKVTFLRP